MIKSRAAVFTRLPLGLSDTKPPQSRLLLQYESDGRNKRNAEKELYLMRGISLDAYGKINWSLAVTGQKEDGYHLLDMLLQSVSLRDSLHIFRSDAPELIVNGKLSAQPEKNLCTKSAEAFYKYTGITEACSIKLEKRIPVCAGMGGGSADAAAVLIGLNILYQTRLKHSELADIALTLGADVPFMLRGGLMRAQGIGEQLTALRMKKRMHLVILMPRRGASTREVFASFESADAVPFNNDRLAEALTNGDIAGALPFMVNHLQAASVRQNPGIENAVRALEQSGAEKALMTGSGSACYGVYSSAEAADNARRLLRGGEFAVYRAGTVDSAVRLTRIY